MQDIPETPEERLRHRRVRRWKRRARIVAPFLGVPILLFALSLSVDLIEYQPRPTREKLTDRPIRMMPKAIRQSISEVPVTSSTTLEPSGAVELDMPMDEPYEPFVATSSTDSTAYEPLPAPTPPERVGR